MLSDHARTQDGEIRKSFEAPEYLGPPDQDPARTNPGLPVVGREHMQATNPIGQGAPPGGDTDYEAIVRGAREGSNPQNVDTMHRAEDDEKAFEASPEFHDRMKPPPRP